jgi:hypothetical protein
MPWETIRDWIRPDPRLGFPDLLCLHQTNGMQFELQQQN